MDDLKKEKERGRAKRKRNDSSVCSCAQEECETLRKSSLAHVRHKSKEERLIVDEELIRRSIFTP